MAPEAHDNPAQNIFRQMTVHILNHRILTLIGLALVTGILVSGMPGIQVNNANRQWFEDGDPTIKRYEKFQEYYGTDKFIYLLLDTPDGQAFSAKNLNLLRELETQLQTITFQDEEVFESIVHIANVNFIEGDATGIEVIELGDGLEILKKILNSSRKGAVEPEL